ncbi:MAG: arylsulfatase, partial [bacterium]|nr:arylsulfatase [bacterium]
KAFPIAKARLTVGDYTGEKAVASPDDTVVVFRAPLKRGETMLKGTFLSSEGKELCGAYYVSVRRIGRAS